MLVGNVGRLGGCYEVLTGDGECDGYRYGRFYYPDLGVLWHTDTIVSTSYLNFVD